MYCASFSATPSMPTWHLTKNHAELKILCLKNIKYLCVFFRWQARKEQDRNMRAGLIPSRALQERRIVHERNEQMKANPEDLELGKFIIGGIVKCLL